MRVVRVRAFNQAGPGQSASYVVGSFTRQVAEAERAGAEECVLQVGNLDSARDFTDVRDVAEALLAARGLPAGEWNVCSGRSHAVRELIALVGAAARIPVRERVEPVRVRGHDVLEVRGSPARFSGATGWEPQIPLGRTVADALDEWRRRLA